MAALGALAAVSVYGGFRLLFFITDDAFIAFRYVSNSQAGYGYVWNPPPFLPVEGYTSFLWVALLDLVWSATGIEPPVSANALALACGYATLGFVVALVHRLALPPALAALRPWLLALVLLGTVTNRTFLAWLSSGLETSLFNLCLTSWLWFALAPASRQGWPWVAGLSATSALTALSRPDGLLVVLGTLALLAAVTRAGTLRRPAVAWLAALPLLAVPLHLAWRRSFYGEWLPNTYYAKYTAPWPASGWRYAAAFVLEYAVWIWIAVALLAAWRTLVRRERPGAGALVAGAVIAGHLAYYTVVIGGDHFEWRVYSYLVPLLFVSLVALAARAGLGPRTTLAALALFVVASWPIPWAHYLETRQLTARQDTRHLFRPIAARFPPGLRAYAAAFDALQAWLIERSVCMRHQEHHSYWRWLVDNLPDREQGSRIGWEGRPLMLATNVGVVSWVYPHVAIIDGLGLSDWVIARTPVPAESPKGRQMAHERRPPRDYEWCFQPNLFLVMGRGVPPQVVRRDALRARPLTDPDIVECEARFRRIAGARAGEGN